MTCFETSRRSGRPCGLTREHWHYPDWLHRFGDPLVFAMLRGWWVRRRPR